MTLSIIYITIAIVLYLIGYIPYIYHVFHGRVVPHPFSYTVWCLFVINSGYILFTDSVWTYPLIMVIVRALALGLASIF